MLARVIRSRVQAGEGDKSIRALHRQPLEGVDQSGADDWTDAGDRAQLREMLPALRARFDQPLESQIDARDELIEARC